MVGEEGPELARLPAGTRVYPNKETSQMMGGETHYHEHVTVNGALRDVKDMSDVSEMIQRLWYLRGQTPRPDPSGG